MASRRGITQLWRLWIGLGVIAALGGAALIAAIVPTTIEDFHLSGTQVYDVDPVFIMTSDSCAACHGEIDEHNNPYRTWSSSKMAHAARNPVFHAQMTLANQDAANAGYFCMRCHAPNTFQTGSALDAHGQNMSEYDLDGVSCHFCHSMVDPIYKPGISPQRDEWILEAIDEVPEHYGNAMFVLDPEGYRRGTREDSDPLHELIHSPFHQTGDFCGTCHDVGNVAISRQSDGSYAYNAIGKPVPDEDLHMQFPLERTYSEWALSEFATDGVDMGGLFGGKGASVVHSCQDCHMPRSEGKLCYFGPQRPDVASHDFAGAGVWSLEVIGLYYEDDPAVDQEAIEYGQEQSLTMLRKAATLDLTQECGSLDVRITNQTGHKLPTGHIEGRRVWVNVQYYDEADQLVGEFGGYDYEQALLDTDSTEVYEMAVGLSEEAAKMTGLPPGKTTRMALADRIVKDSRIPPRGFDNDAYEAAGAPAVGKAYADGQFWDDLRYDVPDGAVRASVRAYYQTMPRFYIEALRDGNTTNHWGDTLYDLWLETDKAPPIEMVCAELDLDPAPAADLNCDGVINEVDLALLLNQWGPCDTPYDCPADLNKSGRVDGRDLGLLLSDWY